MNPDAKDLSGLRYIIVPSKLPRECSKGAVEAHNALFNFWVKHWSKAFAATGAPEEGWEDHFIRQDVCVGLFLGDQVIACHLYSMYDLRSSASLGSEYFHYFSELSIADLKKRRLSHLMSMEYLGVDGDYRINQQNVGLGKLVVALGTRVSEAMGADAALGMPISTTKVDKMFEDVGAFTIQDGIEKYGYTVKLQASVTRPCTPSADEKVRAMTEQLWRTREDYSARTIGKMASIKAS